MKKPSFDTDMVILVVIGLLSVLMFGAIIYAGKGPEHGPSMYDDALRIHDGPL